MSRRKGQKRSCGGEGKLKEVTLQIFILVHMCYGVAFINPTSGVQAVYGTFVNAALKQKLITETPESPWTLRQSSCQYTTTLWFPADDLTQWVPLRGIVIVSPLTSIWRSNVKSYSNSKRKGSILASKWFNAINGSENIRSGRLPTKVIFFNYRWFHIQYSYASDLDHKTFKNSQS